VYSELAPPSKPKSVEAQPCSSSQLKLTETVAKPANFLSNSPQAKELNRAVTYHIARDFNSGKTWIQAISDEAQSTIPVTIKAPLH